MIIVGAIVWRSTLSDSFENKVQSDNYKSFEESLDFNKFKARRECLDMALSGVLIGECSPRFEELSSVQQDDLILRFAAILQSYMYADFNAFMFLRKSDANAAESLRKSRVSGLQGLIASGFGIDRTRVPEQWSGAVGVFFGALYSEIKLVQLIAEDTRVRFFTQGEDEGARAFSTGAHELMHFKSRHRITSSVDSGALVMPHRFPISELLFKNPKGIKCLDLDFHVVMKKGTDECPVEILVRFAWNPEQAEWFIYSAISGYPDYWGPSLPQFPILM